MKIKLLIIIILLQIRILNAQTAFSTSGKSLSNAQVLIDNTIGEPITFTVQNATIRLTQGFQQNNYNIPTGIITAQLDVSINVFPNPTSDKLQIQLSKHYNSNLHLNLYDINGQLIWYSKMGNDVEMQNIDVSKLASGTYILQLTDETKGLINTYKIEKSNN
ncbi:MAG: T9SS type A sorting domain-containing protein [Sphingobacteriales bacterium]|nr:T9SS type A sorting domain-containing protein [Sphingobacteriales bacterium]